MSFQLGRLLSLAVPSLIALGFVFAGAPSARADDPAHGTNGARHEEQSLSEQQRDSQAEVARELATLKQAVGRLEAKVERLLEQPSEFSRVQVKIVDEDHKPLRGFKVTLTSSDEAQRASASGTSDEDGIALTRHLPYGSYTMVVRGNGWYARDRVTVEVGKPLDINIAAPTPDQYGEIVLQASLDGEALEGLRFGGWTTKLTSGTGTFAAPEPLGREKKDLVSEEADEKADEEVDVQVNESSSGGWETFPTLSAGIDTVAVVVAFQVGRWIEQPDGVQRRWQWRVSAADEQEFHLRWLVGADGTLRPLVNAAEEQAEIGSQADWFEALAADAANLNDEDRLGYHRLKLGEARREQATIRLPAGRIEVSIDELYGRPTEDVLRALEEPAESTDGQLWLPAIVQASSKWWPRLLGRSMVAHGESQSGEIRNVVELSQGETQTVTVGGAFSGK